MHDILREHAMILRSLADESDAVADALERQAHDTVPTVYQPPEPDPDRSASDLVVAVPDGHVDVTYHLSTRTHFEQTMAMAIHDARQGRRVLLNYVDDPSKNLIMTGENWERVSKEAPRV
jgi:hypothetical protein